MLNHTGGTYSHAGVLDCPRIPVMEWGLGKFPDSMEFQSWKINFRIAVCMRTADPQVTMHETAQGLADLVSMTLQIDDVQDFDVIWDHALLSVSEMPSDPILEGLYKSKLQNSAQFWTVMALYDQGVARNNGTSNYQQLETAVKLHIDQIMRNRNFNAWKDIVEKRSVTKSRKGNKVCVERKVKECFQWKARGQCSRGYSCSFSHDPLAPGNTSSSQRRKGRSSSPATHLKSATD